MSKKYGEALLFEQAMDAIGAELDWMIAESKGDSPIEKLLYASIATRIRLGFSEYTEIHPDTEKGSFERLWVNDIRARSWLFITPQAQIEDIGRVDFLIRAYSHFEARWRSLIIECDGHDFHERTKQQASRDKSRDRKAVHKGYDCFRFTGSEIWKDPWGIAEEVLDWAVKDWGR